MTVALALPAIPNRGVYRERWTPAEHLAISGVQFAPQWRRESDVRYPSPRSAMIASDWIDETATLERLTRFAVNRRFSRDDASDLASEALLRTMSWGRQRSPSGDEFEKYAFTVLRNLMVDFWQSPTRRMVKRVNGVLSEHTDLFWSDRLGDDVVIGLKSQSVRRDQAFDIPDCDARLSSYLYSEQGLDGKTPSACSTKFLLESLLRWHGSPLSRTQILAVLTSIVVLPTNTISIEAVPEPSTPAPTYSGVGSHLWQIIVTLPYRMKAAVLLNLDFETAQALGAKDVDLQAALDGWEPPPPLSVEVLPISDEVLGSKLSITKENLHTIRCRARKLLQAKFDEGMAL